MTLLRLTRPLWLSKLLNSLGPVSADYLVELNYAEGKRGDVQ